MKAAKELKKLQEKLASGKMTEAEKKALKEQLGEMAKQLEKLANLDERKKQLEEARKNGGLTQGAVRAGDGQARRAGQEPPEAPADGRASSRQAQKHMEKGDMKKAAEALGMTQEQLAEMAKNLQELEALDGAMADLQDAKNGMTGDGMNQLGEALDGLGRMDGNRTATARTACGRGRGQGDRPEAPDRHVDLHHQGQAAARQGQGRRHRHRARRTRPSRGTASSTSRPRWRPTPGNAADALSQPEGPPQRREAHPRLLRPDQQGASEPEAGSAHEPVATWPGPRGFWMSVTSRPRRKIEIVPVDCETQRAMASVVTVITAAASWRVPRPWGRGTSSLPRGAR